jgi:hypothetical protein
MLVMAEMAGGILVASAPTLGPIFFRDRSNRRDSYRDLGNTPPTFGSPVRQKKHPNVTLGGSLFTDNTGEYYVMEDLKPLASPQRV